jgi:hypothetical protein
MTAGELPDHVLDRVVLLLLDALETEPQAGLMGTTVPTPEEQAS